jgi:hypothetical protein
VEVDRALAMPGKRKITLARLTCMG